MRTPDKPGDGIRVVRKRREASSTESELWKQAVADVTPLAGRRGPAPRPGQPVVDAPPEVKAEGLGASAIIPPRPRVRPARAPNLLPELAPGTAAGIDKRTMMRLRRGAIPPETQMDLHNCTQEEAYHLLSGFLAASQASGRRCVLVITGKGYGPGGSVGILKAMVPRWLNEPPNRSRVVAFCHAARSHGGEGALYVLLRRERSTPIG